MNGNPYFGMQGLLGQSDVFVQYKPRPDLTPRQIEWCRAHIPMFAEMQRLRGVK